jgi:hypothetical protein
MRTITGILSEMEESQKAGTSLGTIPSGDF